MNREDFFALLSEYHDMVTSRGGLYTIEIAHSETETEIILLVYFPDKRIDPASNAICIAGGYDDYSTETGDAKKPLAVVKTVLVLTLVVALIFIGIVAGLASSGSFAVY